MKLIKHKDRYYIKSNGKYRKVIATTDKLVIDVISPDPAYPNDTEEVFLPHPTSDFIKAYVKAGGIDEVMVEYHNNYDLEYYTPAGGIECARKIDNWELKVNAHNEITIHPIKNCWSREEVLDFVEKMLEGYKYLLVDGVQPDVREWLNKNLK